jgi:hypothetical protein
MAYFVGKAGEVKIGAATVAEVTAFSYSEDTERIEVVAMQQPKRFAGGTVTGEGTISCNFDPSDTTGQRALIAKVNSVDQTVALKLQPEGDTAAYFELTGTVTVLSWEMEQDAGGIASASFSFAGSLVATDVP